ncbi:rhomboid family intramembrane serine protease [Actinomycetes bacterium M1A6_2h]
MTQPGWGAPPTPPQPGCVRHPDRPTALSCTRCERPACPECLRPAAVGQHCVDCVAEGNKSVRTARTVAGGSLRSGTPVVTYTLIALNVLVYALTALQAGNPMRNQVSSLFTAWALYPPAVADGDFIRVIGSGFLHFGPLHLALNMYALYVIGRDCELIMGRSRYLAVYAVSILGGSAAVMVFQVDAVTAGASGAVFGLLGAQVAILLRMKRSPTPVLIVIGINVVLSFSIPGISLWGHLGGLTAGALATAGLLYTTGSDPRHGRTLGWVAIGVVAAIAIAVILLRALTLRAQLGL